MNVELLERVKAHVLAEPRRVRMEAWCVSLNMPEELKAKLRFNTLEELYAEEHGSDEVEAAEAGFAELLDFPQCGTVACIAGWGEILSQPDPDAALRDEPFLTSLYALSQFDSARRFDIDLNESERLFHVVNWPGKFEAAYEAAETPEGRARVVADRIDHFIATGGRE